MKKLLFLLISVLVMFSFAACGNVPQKESYQPGASTIDNATNNDKNFGINDTAVFDDIKITATEIKESKGEDYFTPEEGKIFVGIKFVIENVSDEEQSVSSLLMFTAYEDDIKSDYSINAACAFDDGTLDGSIMPGKMLVGWYALEASENWSVIEITAQPDLFSNSNAVFKFEK